jgi:branched-chain amino acid transport system substrate-binding protein
MVSPMRSSPINLHPIRRIMMRRTKPSWLAVVYLVGICLAGPHAAMAGAEPIVIGVPTSLGFLEGKESLNAVNLAVEEINNAGGVKVAGSMRPFQVEAIDIRDAAPGVPVPEALLGLEKIILEKKPHAIVVGPFRSEALLAGMDIIAKYKVPMLGSIAMTPASEAKIKGDPGKYKYIFRTCLDAKYLVGYLVGIMKHVEREFGFKKVFFMHQDVLWARKTAEITSGVLEKSGWSVVGTEAYPTGSSDFSAGLLKAGSAGAQVILPVFDMPQSGILVKQWNTMRVPAVMAGFISPLAGSEAWNAFDGKIAGAMNAIFEIGNMPVAKAPASVTFYDAYKKRWGKEVQSGHGPAPSYDSVYVLAKAIETADSLEADAIVAALEKTDRAGVIGRIKYDTGHQVVFGDDPTQTALGCVMQWREGGKRVVVYPGSVAEDTVQLPRGLKPAK